MITLSTQQPRTAITQATVAGVVINYAEKFVRVIISLQDAAGEEASRVNYDFPGKSTEFQALLNACPNFAGLRQQVEQYFETAILPGTGA